MNRNAEAGPNIAIPTVALGQVFVAKKSSDWRTPGTEFKVVKVHPSVILEAVKGRGCIKVGLEKFIRTGMSKREGILFIPVADPVPGSETEIEATGSIN